MLYPGESCPACRAFAPKFKVRTRKGKVTAESFQQVFYDELSRMSREIFEEAKRRAPVDTGALRDSVGGERFRCSYVTVEEAEDYRTEADARVSKGGKRLIGSGN